MLLFFRVEQRDQITSEGCHARQGIGTQMQVKHDVVYRDL